MPHSNKPETAESLPRMAASLVPRELLSWSLIAVAMGALEGGLLGVIVKNQFSGAASPMLVNLSVAVVAGAASFTNLLSFFFASRAMGRGKVQMLARLMLVISACLFAMTLARTYPGEVRRARAGGSAGRTARPRQFDHRGGAR